MSYRIIRDAPLPDFPLGRPPKYPFRDMEIGDAFDVPNLTPARGAVRYPDLEKVASAAGAARSTSHGTKKFVVRLIDDDKTIRCWRVE